MISSSYTPAILEYCIFVKSYGVLDIYTVPLELLFTMKFVAGRDKDLKDMGFILQLFKQQWVVVTQSIIKDWYIKYYASYNKHPKIRRESMGLLRSLPE